MRVYNIICKTQKITKMKHLTLPPTTSLRDLLTHAINESIAMDNIQATDFDFNKAKTFEDESEDLVTVINIQNPYPSDSVEHIEKNSDNFDRVISDFISFLTGESESESETFPLLITNGEGQETLLINISDNYIHIHYNNNGQY